MEFKSTKDKIFIALDFPTADEARDLVNRLGDEATSYKIGLQLFCSAGGSIVKELSDMGKNVFLDLKFHDIPNTVAGAIKSVSQLGANVMNIHCSGGMEMMLKAREAANECGGLSVIGVTVLTSLDDQNLKDLGYSHTAEGQVLLFARQAKEAGLNGIVCSPKEIEIIRAEVGDDFLLITPGIRPAWAAKGDQKRITTPKDALDKGASALVIGRPITAAPDPVEAMRKIIAECQA